jgi:hypothetical protein
MLVVLRALNKQRKRTLVSHSSQLHTLLLVLHVIVAMIPLKRCRTH